ncbi:hypothetical protein BDZ90DRAFT_43882 [Jaminaea rosea]|uniref:Uncharacterized protein n=1 Tax=Jaminaea rosea TaxID=1569628 RepID=A0A316UU38_9BASI|nr:hypothetical protein BDZ90DRAFT_43882 [Jaminaea rosea]PWN26615.1 hypothetical protein BDZ90DRAFT_43882 [Jaminaea rosea]
MLQLVLLFALAATTAVARIAKTRAPSMAQICNRSPNAHCIYTPPGESLANGTAPTIHMFWGQIFYHEVDAINSYTFVIGDDARGNIKIACAKGGENEFAFFFNSTYSSIVHQASSTGQATMGFNDGGDAHAARGRMIDTHAKAVDATIHCPFCNDP